MHRMIRAARLQANTLNRRCLSTITQAALRTAQPRMRLQQHCSPRQCVPAVGRSIRPVHSSSRVRSIVITSQPSPPPSSPSLPAHASDWMDSRVDRPHLHWSRRNKIKSNIVLMGSGKTSVGKILAARLNRRFVDVDDDVLEVEWAPKRVSDVLREVGDDAFLQKEGEALIKGSSSISGAVLSLSGSNPLHPASLSHVAVAGLIVYLDIAPSEILARCERMKVDRIVGQSSRSLESILKWRKSIYENSYDIRCVITEGETPEQIATKIEALINRRANERYVSTRGLVAGDFLDVVAQGLSPDGGLFIPSDMSSLSFTPSEWRRFAPLSYQELALRIIERFPLGERMHTAELRQLLYEGYSSFNHPDILPLTRLNPVLSPPSTAASIPPSSAPPFHQRMWLMETFHGPTASFKDLSLQLLPRLLRVALENQNDTTQQQQSMNSSAPPCVGLLVATSGDTGTAALDGFSRQHSMPVMVLYPSTGVSTVQKAQMQCTAGEDVFVLGIDGADFDFCQRTVKKIFNDEKLKQEFRSLVPNLLLSSANSMNWGRFLPQIVFGARCYLDLFARGELSGAGGFGSPVDVVIPTGNFGNILGVLYAKLVLGLPIRRIISASNSNNILFEFLQSGRYDLRSRKFTQTISPSIDILVSSNLERFLHLLCRSASERGEVKSYFESLAREGWFEVSPAMRARMQKQVQAGWADERQCMDTIRDTMQRTGVLIDPHTAVAVHVANTMLGPSSAESAASSSGEVVPVVVASTAHYAKFPQAMCLAMGKELSPSSSFDDLASLFSSLSSLSPETFSSTMHPQLLSLVHKPRLHDDHCPADLDEIVSRIKTFLKGFQMRQIKQQEQQQQKQRK